MSICTDITLHEYNKNVAKDFLKNTKVYTLRQSYKIIQLQDL